MNFSMIEPTSPRATAAREGEIIMAEALCRYGKDSCRKVVVSIAERRLAASSYDRF